MTEIIVGALALIGTLCGTYWSNRRAAALIAFRLEQLEARVDKHNRLVERTYRLEERAGVQEEKLRVVNHRIGDLEDAWDEIEEQQER